MKGKNRVFRWYLLISIIYSLISILGGLAIIFFKISPIALVIIAVLLSPLILGIFIFNIVMLIVFITGKIEKIAWLLSGLYIFDFIFSAIVGLILFGMFGENAGQNVAGNILGMIFPVVTLIIAVKLIKRR